MDASGSDHNKKKLAKIVVECRKEGLVNYVPPEYLKNDNKDLTKLEWEKCKLGTANRPSTIPELISSSKSFSISQMCGRLHAGVPFT